MISITFYLNYAILIMYLFNLKILICSNSCFKFVKSCIARCRAVNSHSIASSFIIQTSRSLFSPARGCICKQTTDQKSLTLTYSPLKIKRKVRIVFCVYLASLVVFGNSVALKHFEGRPEEVACEAALLYIFKYTQAL